MKYKCFGRLIDVPDSLVDKFTKDFDSLPNSGQREAINELRNGVYEVMLLVQMDPDMLDDLAYRKDFVNSLAIKKAMENNGIMYDA
jgi:hypothetical protein